METKIGPESLAHVADDKILEEAASRLQARHARATGSPLLYGSFRFIFHEGRFQGVEDWARKKSYLSPERYPSSTRQREARNGSRD